MDYGKLSRIIFKIYEQYKLLDDKCHSNDHIHDVIINSSKINNLLGYPYNALLVMTAALYHDIGMLNDRETHHLESAKIVRNDKELKEIFSDEDIELIAKACEEHRSSYKGEFTSLLSKIINDADSVTTIDDMIKRCHAYTKKNNPNLSYDEIFEKVYEHIVDKYGRDGYHKYKLEVTTTSLVNVELIYELIDDKLKFRNKYHDLINRNERYYSHDVLREALDKSPLIVDNSEFFGETEHPKTIPTLDEFKNILEAIIKQVDEEFLPTSMDKMTIQVIKERFIHILKEKIVYNIDNLVCINIFIICDKLHVSFSNAKTYETIETLDELYNHIYYSPLFNAIDLNEDDESFNRGTRSNITQCICDNVEISDI